MSSSQYLWPFAALALWFANMSDALLTLQALRTSDVIEANPAMAWLIEQHPAWFVLYKLGVCSLFIIIMGQLATKAAVARWGIIIGLLIYVPVNIWHLVLMGG